MLAIEAARDLRGSFVDGVYFVPLESLRDPALVLYSIFQTLKLGTSSGMTTIESLIKYLRETNKSGMLIVLDNFEQVIGASTDICMLIAGRTGVKFLITSRERLNITNEHEYAVRPLDLSSGEAGNMQNIPAVQLFMHRAQSAMADFDIGPENASTVLDICKKLDGLPLAIELISARIKFLSPQTILKKLESGMKPVACIMEILGDSWLLR